MSRELIIRAEAEVDLSEAFDWYQDRRAGLGDEFLVEVDIVLARIVDSPLRFAVVYRHVRRALVRRFPYKVVFYMEGDQVTVIAIVHAKRHSQAWQSRV